MRIYLLYGGRSAEHDISILSAFSLVSEISYQTHEVVPVYITKKGAFIAGALLKQPLQSEKQLHLIAADKASYQDPDGQSTGVLANPYDFDKDNSIVFPMLHGTNGEDGTIQGFLDVLDIPYVGDGVMASATGMDKIISKLVFQEAGIPQVPFEGILYNDWVADATGILNRVSGSLLPPLFVKPANAGSSIGISMIAAEQLKDTTALKEAIQFAFKYDDRVIVEQGVPDAREIELAILGNKDVNVSNPGEIGKDRTFYDFNAKFVDGTTKLIIPAPVDADVKAQIQDYGKRAYIAIGGSGLARVDFFLSTSNEVYLNEVQTMPGFTKYSMYPYLWQEMGLRYKDLIDELINLGLERYQTKKDIEANF
ncbi:D-alanine--D-alanine ligase [Agrilactobacillus composti DSM 18527 = JCM 14202]|uniref:D-alanine--D-alanine ligase n=1 Tax=Agrilactobacillus composti DSM 18527 = JCM 14202 TaxID=1423734 RepID=X0PQT3_9LACO|nr:D-alanine--D-alanine ligase family protein [Agrilactobacillus composti]KRM31536.1 D-alanine--D-alanine ligase [Agrilactobacillus composti DSM 18527 = JCM 14202]GAF39446.1 D-alanine-D-alanine ligase [Agrilactobacillus composti DSM 18527 = JCM 14202]